MKVQAATCIALTKLDVLSYMDRIPVCTHYLLDGKVTDEFPFPAALPGARPVFEYLPGFGDVADCRGWEQLPQEAKDYIGFIEEQVGCHIKYVSVGAQRAVSRESVASGSGGTGRGR